MIDITIKNLSKSYFSEKIFTDINIDIKKTERVALLGENGTGKTTIFEIIFGIETPDSGDLFVRKGAKIGYLRQTPREYTATSVKDVLLFAFASLSNIKNKMSTLENEMATNPYNLEKLLKEYGKTQEEYEVIGGYKIDEKMSKVCEGLNFSTEILNKDYSVLSGGEKTRIELGKLLLEEPEILLLDEPTNHLDIETTEWLENYLKGYKGSVLIISHDRYFLDKVIDRIYEIKAGITKIYLGNYSYYLKEREVRYNNQLKHFGVQQNEIKNMEAAIKRFRQWGAQADNEAMFAKAKAIEKKLDKMDKIDRPIKDSKGIKIDLQAQGRSAKQVITITNYNLLVTGKILVEHMNFNIRYKEKVALIGANGTGKTTLIRNVLKSIENEDDRIKVGPSVKIGYLEQDVKFSDEEKSILETLQFTLCMSPGEARNYLAKFKFYRDDVFKKVKNLSGGEKIRLILSLMIKQDINFLILDEPTNHIDIKTKEVLEETLNAFKGTILFISHDRYFLNKLATKIYEIENSQLHEYLGNYEFYKLEKEKRAVKNTLAVTKSSETSTEKFAKVKTIHKKTRTS